VSLMSGQRIRKPVNELTASDFLAAPVWEFALDEEGEEGQDETTVRPYPINGELDTTEGMFVIRARFALADGTIMQGYLTPPTPDDSGLGTLQPIILTPHGQVMFWWGSITPEPAHVAESYSRLGKTSPAEVFPVRYESAVPLKGGKVRGEVPGFLILEDFRTMRTRVVK
jgi:hypothetical protein